MRQGKKFCNAPLVLGDYISKVWIQCEKRKEGLCCKDCAKLHDCKNPCGKLIPYFRWSSKQQFDFPNYFCPYFLTKWEAILKRLDSFETRGIRK